MDKNELKHPTIANYTNFGREKRWVFRLVAKTEYRVAFNLVSHEGPFYYQHESEKRYPYVVNVGWDASSISFLVDAGLNDDSPCVKIERAVEFMREVSEMSGITGVEWEPYKKDQKKIEEFEDQ